MKKLSFIVILFFSAFTVVAQTSENKETKPDPNKPLMEIETSCGQCQLGLKGDDCDLAVRINGKAYFVDGTKIDDHGDAHAKDGFCNKIRKAKVQGEVKDNRFVVTYFKLLKENEEKK